MAKPLSPTSIQLNSPEEAANFITGTGKIKKAIRALREYGMYRTTIDNVQVTLYCEN